MGSALTLIIAVIVLVYATTKTTHLSSVYGQTISTYFEDANNNSIESALNLNFRDLKIAFAFEGYLDNKLKFDPRYVRIIFRLGGKRQNLNYERFIDYHICTEQDYEKFYPISEENQKNFNSTKDSPDRGFLCIDWKEEEPYLIYGKEESADYEFLEVILAPCNYVHKEISEHGLPIDPQCIYDSSE